MTFRIFPLLILISISLTSFSQNKPRANSIFWEISGGDLDKPSFIYGTMHVNSKIAFKLPESFFKNIESADAVALESLPDSWERELSTDPMMSYLGATYRHREGSTIHRSYDLYTAMTGIFSLSNGHLKWLLSRNSAVANQMLYRDNAFGGSLTEDTYLDMYIFQMGKKMNKNMIGLEDIKVSTIKSYKASLEEYARVDNRKDKFTNSQALIVEAYEAKDIDKIDSCYKQAFGQGYLYYLLYSRNDDMLQTFDSVVATGQNVFMAVGAAHLSGEKGILSQLEKRGYTVKPVLDSAYYDPSAALLKFDTIFISSTFEKHWSIDSTLYFESPGFAGRQVETGLVEYLSTDMPNAVYYRVDRVPLFHGFVDNGNLPKRVDSLIYESTPGKILTRENIRISGYDGVLVHSESDNARQVWNLILYTPYELLLAEVQGPLKWEGEESALRFLHSIDIDYTRKSENDNIEGPYARLEKSFADAPYSEYDLNIPMNMYCGTYNDNDYMFVKALRGGENKYEENEFETESLIRGVARMMKADVVQIKPTIRSGVQSSWGTLKNESGIYHAMTVAKADRYYMVITNDKSAHPKSAMFDYLYESSDSQSWNTYTNDSMGYSIVTPLEPYGKILNPFIFKRNVTSSSFTNEYRKLIHTNYFQSPKHGYDIKIDVNLVNPYAHFDDERDLWDRYEDDLEETYVYTSKNILKPIDSFKEPGKLSRTYYITDSVSSSYMIVNLILTGNREYIISSALDKNDAIHDRVAESIKNTQVENLGSVYSLQSTFDTFHAHIFTSDSLTQKIFEYNKNQFSPAKSDFEKIIYLIDTSEVLTRRQPLYYTVLDYLSKSHDQSTRDYLHKLYLKNDKNFNTQFEVLYVLANMDDTAATMLLKDLMIDLPPLESSNSPNYVAGVNGVLSAFRFDTALAPLLFPDIMELMDYDEYNGPVTNLTTAQVRFCGLDTSYYAVKRSYFYKKLRAEFRRQTSQQTLLEKDDKDIIEDEDSDYDYYRADVHYSINTEKLIDDYLESDVNLYSYYNLIKYYELLKDFRNYAEVDKLLSTIDNSPNTDLKLYRAMDRVEDSLDYDPTPIKEHIQRERYGLYLISFMIENEHASALNKMIPNQDTFALWMAKYKMKFKEKDEIKIYAKRKIEVKDTLRTMYIFEYKKDGFEKDRMAFLGLFDPGSKYLDDYIWLDDVKLEELNMSLDEFVKELKPQFEALGRSYVDPSDYSIFLDPNTRDPFYYQLFN